MGTEYIFKSCFASLITNYFSYRNENYLSCNDYTLALRDFDKFCIDNHIDTNTLAKEIVIENRIDEVQVCAAKEGEDLL